MIWGDRLPDIGREILTAGDRRAQQAPRGVVQEEIGGLGLANLGSHVGERFRHQDLAAHRLAAIANRCEPVQLLALRLGYQ